jgi:hypothetical protein
MELERELAERHFQSGAPLTEWRRQDCLGLHLVQHCWHQAVDHRCYHQLLWWQLSLWQAEAAGW